MHEKSESYADAWVSCGGVAIQGGPGTSTSAPRGMDGMWSRNSFLLDSSSLAINQYGGLLSGGARYANLQKYFSHPI